MGRNATVMERAQNVVDSPRMCDTVNDVRRKTVQSLMVSYDFNGEGKWAKDEIISRYATYCRELHISEPIDLTPTESRENATVWIFPVMEKVIKGIENGDAACRRIGVEFIEEDRKFSFGKIIKANTARALRRSELTADEKTRVRRRVVAMLIAGHVPREYKQYAKLLKKIGVGDSLTDVEKKLDHSNQYVVRFYEYLNDGK